MSNLSSLEIGKRALLTQKLGLDVTSNNIANVNTPGYSRRTVVISETPPILRYGQYIGTGVEANHLRSFREEYFDKEIRTSISRQMGYEADEKILQRIQAVLAEPSESGISEIVDKFLNDFNELALRPENLHLRELLLQTAQTLAERFNTTAMDLAELRAEAFGETQNIVTKINGLVKDIAELNKNIVSSKSLTSNEAITYLDQRATKIEELSKLAGVTATYSDNGSANVFINGINIITGQNYTQLKALEMPNSVTGERTLQIAKLDYYGNVIGSVSPQTGELASYLNHFNVTLDDKDTSGGFSTAKQLNEFAAAIAQKVNALTVGGYGLDDTDAAPPGRYFFEPTAGEVTAFNIRLSDDVKGNPRGIPLSGRPGEPGNNSVALAIARLSGDTNFVNGETPSSFYAGFLSKIGQLASDAAKGKATTQLVTEQLNNQRESAIGVNLDEEAINLIKYQKAFEAASRVINVTNELLGTIVNLGR